MKNQCLVRARARTEFVIHDEQEQDWRGKAEDKGCQRQRAFQPVRILGKRFPGRYGQRHGRKKQYREQKPGTAFASRIEKNETPATTTTDSMPQTMPNRPLTSVPI